MKAGLTTSMVLHAAILGFGLVSLSAPAAFEVADVESLPVDIVPVESITQIQQGDKKSPMNEKPAPLPTKRPDIVADASKVGEAMVDSDSKPTPEPTPRPVEAAAVPPPSPKPEPKPIKEVEPEPVKQPEPKPEPVPATEVTPQPQPKQDVKPDPVEETIAAAEEAAPDAVALPDQAPAPAARPQPPKAQTAKAPDRKDSEKPVKEATAKPKSEEKEFDADEVAALLNKQKPSGGGAKRSTQTASLGGKTNEGSKLSQSETDALRSQVQRCWSIPAGAADGNDLRVSVKAQLSRDGMVEGAPQIISGGGSSGVERAAAEAARRAILRCGPYNLPAEKFEGSNGWNEVVVNFDPSEMF